MPIKVLCYQLSNIAHMSACSIGVLFQCQSRQINSIQNANIRNIQRITRQTSICSGHNNRSPLNTPCLIQVHISTSQMRVVCLEIPEYPWLIYSACYLLIKLELGVDLPERLYRLLVHRHGVTRPHTSKLVLVTTLASEHFYHF